MRLIDIVESGASCLIFTPTSLDCYEDDFQYSEPVSRPDVIHHFRMILRQIMNMMTHCDTPTRSLFFQSVQE